MALFREIGNEEVTCKLLYVTPEQLTLNTTLIRILQRQQKMQNFSRMVIDEVVEDGMHIGNDRRILCRHTV